MTARIIRGDCLDVLPTLPDASFDAVITDPPYPHIKREYGEWTADEWLAMMRRLVPELRRVLTPTGSCMMVLQPNSERVGRMRTWLWEFMAWVGNEWGIVQDAYWWNMNAIPGVHSQRENGLMRPSLKVTLWIGLDRCYRNQAAVLLPLTPHTIKRAAAVSDDLVNFPSGWSKRGNRPYKTAVERGGATPLNVQAMSGAVDVGRDGHGAGTPLELCRWWTRYICPPGGRILDPFAGSGTTGIAAIEHGCEYVGIERYARYIPIAEARLAKAGEQTRMAV